MIRIIQNNTIIPIRISIPYRISALDAKQYEHDIGDKDECKKCFTRMYFSKDLKYVYICGELEHCDIIIMKKALE